MEHITVAVAGQPNCGKSTMFNAITGASARVGNYPGITVDRLEGRYRLNGHEFHLVDLPGTYSLTAYSKEEVVARDVIVDERPDVVLCMLDSTALERSLYLVVQLMEMEVPMVLGLNMMDEAKRQGLRIDAGKLAELFGVPVVECIARLGKGKNELMEAVGMLVDSHQLDCKPPNISYGPDLDPAIRDMAELIETQIPAGKRPPARWLAIKVLEGDEDVLKRMEKYGEVAAGLKDMSAKAEKRVADHTASYPEAIISDRRYGFINGLMGQGVLRRKSALRLGYSSKIDRVLTHRLFGPLIMLGVLWSMFYITFTLGATPQGWVADFFGWLGGLGEAFLPDGLIKSLVVSGVLDGVGAVMSFTPLIMIMFTMLVFLEDLGYMARVAYMVDRLFRAFGLHGMSVMPLVMAGGMPGGCAVPGVMCSRTLRSPRERLATILTAPFNGLRGQGDGLHSARGRIFPGSLHRGHVFHSPGLLVLRAVGLAPAALDGDQGPPHALCHGASPLPTAHSAGGGYPCLGARLAIHQKGWHRDPGHFHRDVVPYDLPPTAPIRGGQV